MWLINNYNKNDTEYFEYSNHRYYTKLTIEELRKEGHNINDYDIDLKTGKVIIKPPKPKEKEKTNKEIINEWLNQEEVKEKTNKDIINEWLDQEEEKDKKKLKKSKKYNKYYKDVEDDLEYQFNKFYKSHGIKTQNDYNNDYDDYKYKTIKKCKKPKIRNNRK